MDWHTYDISGFAIAEWAQEFADLRFADFKKKVCLPTSVSLQEYGWWSIFQKPNKASDRIMILC
jgi:hypothetical protein